MKVSMSNVKMSSKRIKNNILKKAKPITILIPTDTIDYSSIKTGLMPNFIHSLDASNIHILIKKIKSILPVVPSRRAEGLEEIETNPINLFTIHDCFATDASSMQILELLVKISFVEIYFTQNYLEFIHKSFIKQIEGITELFKDDNGLYILVPSEEQLGEEEKLYKKYLPSLPDYD